MPARSPSSSKDSSTDRRQFLASVGTLASTLLAGCSSSSDDAESPEPTPTQTPDPTPEPSPTPTPEPTPEPTPTPTPEPTEAERIATSFEKYTTPLDTVDPSAPRDDLAFLRDDLAEARIIGMGEATHGTREFFQFKDRLFRYLVEELGVRVFAWEASFGTTRTIDRYIRTGEGGPESAIEHVGFWIWEVESVRTMVEWMREFNDGREPDDKIQFYGIDMQSPAGEITELQSVFDEADDDFFDSHTEAVAAFEREKLRKKESELETVRGFVPALQEHLDTNEEELVAATSRRDYEFARRHARVLEQRVEYATAFHEKRDGESALARNRAMAENTQWVLERDETDQLALWMHNGHINQNKSYDTGGILTEQYGDDYYSIGMEFDHGSFQAMEYDGESLPTRDDIREFTVEPAPDGSLPSVLSTLEMPYAFVDLVGATDDSQLAQWLATPPKRTLVGAAFSSSRSRFATDSIAGDFDALLFVDETERARRL